MKAFFEGDVAGVQQDIVDRINHLIPLQQFELAQQYKEIYEAIDARVEQQTVIVPDPVSGNILFLAQVGSFYVFVWVKLFEGKVIDVIRDKVSQSESDLSTLIASWRTEIQNTHDISFDHQEKEKNSIIHYLLTKQLSKEHKETLLTFLERILSAFLASDSFQEHSIMNDLLQELQTTYQLKNIPYHIECIDISHFGGDYTAGGLSCLQ